MNISNVCVCNKYWSNEYECIYTNIHEATCTHTFNLTNICCILTEYKLGLGSDGSTQNSFPMEQFKGRWDVHHYSGGGSQSVLLAQRYWHHLETCWKCSCFFWLVFFNLPLTSWISTLWIGVPIFMFLESPQGSLMHMKVSGLQESFNVLTGARVCFQLGTFAKPWRRKWYLSKVLEDK